MADEDDDELDARFTFSNERTFLAWNRTALALIAAGAAAAGFLKHGLAGGRIAIAVPPILLGAAISVASLRRWEQLQRAMEAGEPLPPSSMPRFLAASIAVIAVIVVVFVAVDALT